MFDGHHLPTASLIAWLVFAGELGADPHLFKSAWLRELATMCALTDDGLGDTYARR